MTLEAVLRRLRAMASSANAAGMARFGIRPRTTILGISIWKLRTVS